MTLSPATLYPVKVNGDSPLLKICNTCYQPLPVSYFEKANYGTTLRGDCKDCRRAKKLGKAKAAPLLGPDDSKICVRCGKDKPVAEFTRVTANVGGLHSYCKECKTAGERARATAKAESTRLKLQKEYAAMDPNQVPNAKACSNPHCALLDAVQPAENFDRSPIHPSGLRMDCRICALERRRAVGTAEASKEYHQRWYQENKSELSQRTKEWRDANPEECRRLAIARRFRQYGTTPEWYDATLAIQGGGCAICGSKDPKGNADTFHVDHDHSCCNKGCHACDECRRGLLCGPCNTRLGHLENEVWKRQAMAYLNKWRKDGKKFNEAQDTLFDL